MDVKEVVSRMEKFEDRLTQIEWSVLDHSRTINDLARDGEIISRELTQIQKTLMQIKYFAMGATALYMANSIGLTSVLKLIGV